MRMSRNAFTMLELIFVIVILGVLATITIPKLAATRDDARVTKLKALVKQAQAAVPSHYTGQTIASFKGAMVMKTSANIADKNIFVLTNNECTATYTDNTGDNIIMQIVEDASTAPSVACTEGTIATDENLSLLITYNFNFANNSVVSQVAELNNILVSGDSKRFPLGGQEVSR